MFFAFLVLIASLHEDGLLAVYRMEDKLSIMQMDNERLEIENERLGFEIQALKTEPAGIEKIAREKLNLVKPGELIYRIIPVPSSTDLPKVSSKH